MNYYYADSQNNRTGPVTWDFIQQLIRSGALTPDHMVAQEGGNEWRPLSFWEAQNKPGAPASPAHPSTSADRAATASPDTRTAFKILATNPVGGLSAAFENLGPHRGMVVGISLGAIFVLSCVLVGYRLKSAFPVHLSLGFAVYCKAFAMTLVPFVGLLIANFGARMLFRGYGSWGHDCFIAGASVAPLALPILVACVVGIGENPIIFTLLVTVFSATLAGLILFAGLTQIYRIPIRPASFLAPLELAIVTLAVHIISKVLFTGSI